MHKTKKTIKCVGHHNAQRHTNNVNKNSYTYSRMDILSGDFYQVIVSVTLIYPTELFPPSRMYCTSVLQNLQ
jgi:hypothetical protein